mmetsp:Transcript_34080/g.89482  ORF Transcript_34080/g.89482 Transcript_34080/m.89482 type:complete len:622 (-) Transcript_34080:1232-3097(-)|eukprot:CAMPEP_0182923344 /NCGR_PEP_ID=MMETSP0105_2-20130417/5367_1 /TAXON_ID=81532 ORGANISM="Acanthoeca-like sp., Strain 10tr" /NCGR_SAMPLE_ID=MMETSP0105_2 /ASSEMBLY_ACC=CAM_ASM_000205 /LENGTH=621 /DNA_ID=CAMNT_0025061049 /DNA_START=146 /DNA_END=2011 /DNA_ORIENTATION=-
MGRDRASSLSSRWLDVKVDSDEPHPVLTSREKHAWYSFDFANSAFMQVVMSMYLPLLLQSMALEKAGFPYECPNYAAVTQNHTLSRLVFGHLEHKFFRDNLQIGKSPCTSNCVWFEGEGYCRGLPETSDDCLTVDGRSMHPLKVTIGGWDMNPSEYSLTFISISVLCQAIAFISVGALGDYGTNRKLVFVVTSMGGSIACICTIAVTPDVWWLGGIIMIIANVLYGVSYLMYSAWLPLLAAAHPETRAVLQHNRINVRYSEYERIFQAKSDDMSSVGFQWGYVGGVSCLILTMPFLYTLELNNAYRVGIVIGGLWWFTFQWPAILRLHARPGPPLPADVSSYIGYSWYQTAKTMKHLREIPTTARFITYWFFYSDGFNTIGNIAAVLANDSIEWGCVSKSTGLSVIIIGGPLLSLAGLKLVTRYQKMYKWSPKNIVIGSLLAMSFIPAYAILGFFTDRFGMHFGWELFLLAAIYGPCIGVVQSYSRSLLSTILPKGHESQFFSFYEVTDKGSSWLGPMMVAMLARNGNVRYAFVFILFMLLIPAALLHYTVDERKGVLQAEAYARKHPVGDPLSPSLSPLSPCTSDDGERSFLLELESDDLNGTGVLVSPNGWSPVQESGV